MMIALTIALSFCGFLVWVALVIWLFQRDGNRVVEPGEIDEAALEGDLRHFVVDLNDGRAE